MNEELIKYYVNLLILQYRDKEKAQATIAAFIDTIMIYDLMKEVEAGYDPESAIGVQLDIVAKYVGADRVVTGIAFGRTFFGFVDYAEPTPYVDVEGMIEYDQVDTPDAQWLTYETDQQSIYSLTDQELRDIINLKIGQNSSNHSPGSIDLIIDEFFGGNAIFTDNLNMTISYIFDEDVQRLVEIAVSQMAILKPMAVGLTTSFVPDINNIFGMIKYDADAPADFVEGFVEYADSSFGGWLKY